jgi:hypothetical protein
MGTVRVDRRVLTDPSWWQWVVTAPLLAAHLCEVPHALAAATLLCVAAAIVALRATGGWRPFPAQIRLAFLALLAAGTVPGLWWVHAVQAAGTTAMVTTGYCPLVRLLLLLPWNRDWPLNLETVAQTFLYRPGAGGLVRFGATPHSFAAASCSL